MALALGLSCALLGGCLGPAVPPKPSPGPLPPAAEVGAAGVSLPVEPVTTPLRHWQADTPVAQVLALHGYNDYGGAFAALGQDLSRRGISVFAYDQRGFGASLGVWPDPHRSPDVDRLSADLASVAQALAERDPERPLFLLGESMGAAVALVALERYPELPVAGVILQSPALWGFRAMRWYERWVLRGALGVSRAIRPEHVLTGARVEVRASDNRARLIEMALDPRVRNGASVASVADLMTLMDAGLAALPSLAGPGRALVLYGRRDEVIPREALCALAERWPPAQALRTRVYADGYHMLTRDLGGAQVRADIGRFILGEPVPASVAGADALADALGCPSASAAGR